MAPTTPSKASSCVRQSAKDFEALIESSRAWFMLAIASLLRRTHHPRLFAQQIGFEPTSEALHFVVHNCLNQ
jgi:hypothetical protein